MSDTQMKKPPTQKIGDEQEARSLAIESLVQADFSREWINGNDAVQRELGRFAAEYSTQLSSDREGVQHAADELAQEWKQREQKEFVREVPEERRVEVPEPKREERPAVPEPRGEIALPKVDPKDKAESTFYVTRSSTADKTAAQELRKKQMAEFGIRSGVTRGTPEFAEKFKQEQREYDIWRNKAHGGAEHSDELFAQFLEGHKPAQEGAPAQVLQPETIIAQAPVQKASKEETDDTMLFTSKQVFTAEELAGNEPKPKELDESTKDLLDNYAPGTTDTDSRNLALARIAEVNVRKERLERGMDIKEPIEAPAAPVIAVAPKEEPMVAKAPAVKQEKITLAKIHETLGGRMPRTPIESLETKNDWLRELEDTYSMKEQDYVNLVTQESAAREVQIAAQPITPVATAPEKVPKVEPVEKPEVVASVEEKIKPIEEIAQAGPVKEGEEATADAIRKKLLAFGKMGATKKVEGPTANIEDLNAQMRREGVEGEDEKALIGPAKRVDEEAAKIGETTVAAETKGPQDDAKKRALRAALMTPMDSNRKLVGGGPKVKKAEKAEISLTQLQRDARGLEGDLHRLDGFETELKEETAKWESIKDKDSGAALSSSARMGEIRKMIDPINKTIGQFEDDYAALEATGADMKKGLGTGEYSGTEEREDIRTPAEMMRRINIRRKEGA